MANLVQKWFSKADAPDPIPEKKAIDPANFFAQFLPSPFYDDTAAGIGPDTALKCLPVRACVACISDSLAALPLHLYRRLPDGSKERATEHQLYALLHDAPNDWTSAFEFRRSMQADLLLHGKSFAFINRVNGGIVEIIRLEPTAVDVDVDATSGEPTVYKVTSGAGVQRSYQRRDILHLQALRGVAPIRDAAKAISTALLLESHAAKLFKDGARPAGLLETDGALSDVAMQRLAASFEAGFAGVANAGKTAILEEGLKFKALTLNSTDAQFLELRKFQVEEIARAFRVPLHKIGSLERATFSNIEHQALEFVTDCLMPWLTLWEQGISRSLLEPDERKQYFCEFLIDSLLRGDLKSRMEAFASAAMNRILTINEIRAMENRPPLPGGDVARAPLNQSPIDAPPAPMDGPPK